MADQGLRGVLSPKDESLKSRYPGHRVRLEFINPPSSEDDLTPSYRTSLTAPVDNSGAYSFVVDERVLKDQTAVLEVRSPLGTRLFSDSFSTLLEGDRIRTITVDPETPFEITPHPDPLKGKRVAFIARVIDRDSKRDVANRQVLIFASPAGSDDEELEVAGIPVFAGRTNEKGYVSGEHPAGIFAAAIAEIDGIRAPVRLEADGSFPLRAVLVVPLPPESTTPGGRSAPPRAPDEEELLSTPELFSNDLGVGSCVDFTVPNRTLEEIPFYKIVRTTDPDIKGTTLEAPIKLQPDFELLIKQLAFGLNTLDSKLKVRRAPDLDIGVTSGDPLINTDVIATPRVEARFEATTADATRTNRTKQPPLEALATNGIVSTAEWREAISTTSIDVALKESLPALSAESLRSVLVDPDQFTPVSLMTAERLSAHQLLSELVRVSRKPVAGRGPLDELNPVDWDDTPTFYQATEIAHGHLLQFRQVWKADGYSLGDLLHSIPLAPCQKKQIVTIDWDRREDAARTEELTEREFLFANLVRDRDVKEMMDTALSEEIDGGSSAKTYGGGGGLGFAIGPLVIGAAGGGAGADSEAWQNSSREISAETMHELKDRINQSAAAVRSQRATVVQTLGQGERTRVETEVIANHNHCHALTIQYFEVLRHFQVSEELAEVRECLFVPFLMSRFEDHKVLRWRDALSRNLRKRRLLPAFDAIDRIQLNYLGSDLPLGMFAEEPLESLDGELRVSITIARPRDPKTDEPDYFENVWPFWPRLIGGNPADVYDRFLQNQQFKDRIFREQLAPQIAEKFIASLRVVLLTDDGAEIEASLDPTLASKYRVGQTHMVTLVDSGNTPTIPRKNIVAIELRTDHQLPEHSQVIVESASFLYSTRHLRQQLYHNDRMLDDLLLGDPVFLSTSRLNKEEQRNPRAEDQELKRRLLTHLNGNLEYYHKAMWWTLDKERRFILLDGFIAPHSNGRSVASVVHNDLIGIVGNSLVFPVVAGFQLDPRYRALLEEAEGEGEEIPRKPPPTVFDLYAPITPDPPRLLSVPTKGVFAEAVMGACNSCEKIDESRFWRWSQSPCPDDPPPIAPVDVTSRAGEVPNLTATDFPAPIVNFQNIPEAPDPTGLGAVLQLIGRGDIFRDITGLTENQKNALATLQSSLSTAQAFGQEAIQLAHAQAAEKSIDQTLNSVLEAKKDGRLSDAAARAVMKGALQNFLGQQGQQSTSVVDSESITEAVGAAVDAKNAKLTVTEEKAGEQQTVEVSKEGPGAEGQATPFKFHTIDDNFITVSLLIDEVVTGTDEFKLTTNTDKRSALRKQMRIGQKVGGKDVIIDWMDIGEKANFLKAEGTDGFKVNAQLHICYPRDPTDPDKLKDSANPYPIVAILHGQNAAWDGDPKTQKKIGTDKDINGVTRDVITMTPSAQPQIESYKGFEYLQQELANHGIVSVSINCNLANQVKAEVRLRSEMLFGALDALRTRKDGPFKRYSGKLDFTNIGLIGHSKGGDAAIDAAKRKKQFGIKALGLIAPADATGSVPKGKGRLDLETSDNVSLFMLYGSHDSDISGVQRQISQRDLGGTPFRHYDRAAAPKVLAFALGCSHTAFNANPKWIFPEPDILPPASLHIKNNHQELAKVYLTAFFRRELGTATAAEKRTLRKLFDGTQQASQKIPVGLSWDFGSAILRVDDFESANNNLGHARTLTPAANFSRQAFSPLIAATTDVLDLKVWHRTTALIDRLPDNATHELTENIRDGSTPRNLKIFDVLTFRLTRDYNLTDQSTIESASIPAFAVTLKNVSNEGTVSDIDVYAHNVLTPNKPQFCKIRFQGAERETTKIFFETYQIPLDKFQITLDQCTELRFKFGPFPGDMRVVIDDISFVQFEPRKP